VVQPMYSLVKRQAEVEILPMAEANGIGVIPYSPSGAGLLSGKNANEAMMSQIEVSNQWNHYQAKSIKASVLDAKMTLTAEASEKDKEKAARYEEEQKEIKAEAERTEEEAKTYFHKHEIFARSVTMFQIAIAIAAISALTRKRTFWFVSLVFGLVGIGFLVQAWVGH